MKSIITILPALLALSVGAQTMSGPMAPITNTHAHHLTVPDTLPPIHRRVLWVTPVAHPTIIEGVAFGAWTYTRKSTLAVRGVNLELNPVALMALPYLVLGDITGPFNEQANEGAKIFTNCTYPENDTQCRATITGLNVTTLQMGGTMKGVGLNIVCGAANDAKGLEVSGLMNMNYSENGVSVSVRNKATHCKGVQLGLFNECKKGTLVQIGLLNRIGNRTTPIVNFSLRRKNRST